MQPYITSLGLAKELKGMGFPQETQFYWRCWVDSGHVSIIDFKSHRLKTKYHLDIAAPMFDEVLKLLPARLDCKDRSSWNLAMWKTEKDLEGNVQFSMDYTEGMTSRMLVSKTLLEQNTPSDAAATLYIWLAKHNYLK